MQAIPEDVSVYNRTPEFSEASLPDALRKAHRTKPGVWGRIVVLEGELRYRIYGPPLQEYVLSPERFGTVEPAVSHEVEPVGVVRFYVEFLR